MSATLAPDRPRPSPLDRVYSVVAFDWDSTALPDRLARPAALRDAMERLLGLGAYLAVLTGTNLAHVDRALRPSRRAPALTRLLVSTNRGAELYGYDPSGEPLLLTRRTATPKEDAALDAIADRVAAEVRVATGLDVVVIRDRLCRRKIDLFPAWREPPKEQIDELVVAVEARLAAGGWRGGLGEVVRRTQTAARELGLPRARVTSDGKHVEVGLTDKGDGVDAVLDWLDEPAEDVMLVGDESGPVGGASDTHTWAQRARRATFVSPEPEAPPDAGVGLGAGPDRLVALLAQQAELRAQLPGAPPPQVEPSADHTRRLVEHTPLLVREHETESIFSVGNGAAGVRGSLSEGSPRSTPATTLAGVWVRPNPDALPRLAVGPDWTGLRIGVGEADLAVSDAAPNHERTLDLGQGMYWRTWRHEDAIGRRTELRVARFASIADRRLLLERVEVCSENWGGELEIEVHAEAGSEWEGPHEGTWTGPAKVALAATLHGAGAPETATPPRLGRWTVATHPGATWRLDRACAVSRDPAERVAPVARGALVHGIDLLAHDHATACRARVASMAIHFDGDDSLQRAFAFSTHHLVAAANPDDEHCSIGARGLTGTAYLGHVFWDTELWMMPVYTLTWPRAARALAMYRWHTLPAARERAAAQGYRGALYAWESAATGQDVTPTHVHMPDGSRLPVLAGELEHHISAAVAWAAWHYWSWTGDDAYLRDAGAEVILETARFWASRGRIEADGRWHIRGVVGPDEYHGDVDDNAYTNGMAAWNLHHGVSVARILAERWPARWARMCDELGIEPDEPARWSALAAAVYDGFEPKTGRIEQFAGYFALEDISLAGLSPRVAPVDMLLGPERVRRSQLIKQPDVLMLLALLPDRFPPEVHRACWEWYEPRTAHGSSLSPPVHAALAARLGDPEATERYLRLTAAIDLDNGVGSAATGVHLGALGGLWQAAVFGLGGLRIGRDGPALHPWLPPFVERLAFPLEWRERRYRAEIRHGAARLVPEGPW